MTEADQDITELHVMSCDDAVEHEPDISCICGPTIDTERPPDTAPCLCGCVTDPVGMVWVHHSLDGREQSKPASDG